MASLQESSTQTEQAPYLLYYVNALIQNEFIVKEQNEYIEKLKRKLDLMKKLKETSDVYDCLDTISSIEGIIDKNASTIKSLEKQIQDMNTKLPMPSHNNN